MKKLLLLIAVLLYSIGVYSQSITGSWLITKVEMGDNIQEPFFIIDFKENGSMEALEMEIGSWSHDASSDIINMTSEFDKNFNGEHKIVTLNDEELIIDKGEERVYYLRLDKDAILKNNEASKLEGTWNIENDNESLLLLKFETPDSFVLINSDGGMTETTNGTWIYNPTNNSLIVIGFTDLLGGVNKITTLEDDKLVLENNGTTIVCSRDNSSPDEIERLKFEFEDLEENVNSDYIIPTYGLSEIIESLTNVNYLNFKLGILIEEMGTLKYKTTLSYIETDIEQQSVLFSNFEVYQGDTMQYSQNYKDEMSEAYNDFFPFYEPEIFRIVGVETINIPAGTFECTIIEGFIGYTKVKYWMINDKPGIYARIIKEGESMFDNLEYSVMELIEINTD